MVILERSKCPRVTVHEQQTLAAVLGRPISLAIGLAVVLVVIAVVISSLTLAIAALGALLVLLQLM
jgi:uncharacterized membrane protein